MKNSTFSCFYFPKRPVSAAVSKFYSADFGLYLFYLHKVAQFTSIGYNETRDSKSKKAGREALPTPHAPMQENGPPTQQISAPPILSNIHRLIKREKWECVFSFRRCRDLQSLRRFCCLDGKAYGGREIVLPPKASTIKTGETLIKTKERTI